MWFTNLLTGGGVGTTVLMLSVSIFAGLLLGKLKVKGISLGITWVLFVGILISALGVACNHDMLHIVKELGLILFVTAVGLQVGPGFFRTFKTGGLPMNLMAVVNVALGVGLTVLIAKLAGEELTDMAGVYTGAITNTPGLSAAQQAVGDLGIEGASGRLAAGYAVAYPLAVVGMIMCCILLRPLCRIDMAKEPTTVEVQDNAGNQNVPESPKNRKPVLLIPVFVVIALGILLGSIPVPVGMKAPVKLGLAGGPLVVSLVAGWLGVKKGWFSTDFTEGHGIHMLREVGIALFLAGVGLSAGADFATTGLRCRHHHGAAAAGGPLRPLGAETELLHPHGLHRRQPHRPAHAGLRQQRGARGLQAAQHGLRHRLPPHHVPPHLHRPAAGADGVITEVRRRTEALLSP